MKDIRNILENIKIPEFETDVHKNILKKHLLNEFTNSKSKNLVKGGEYLMFLKSNTLFGKIAVGALVLFLAIAIVSGFNPFDLQKANAQNVAKKALEKVSSLSEDDQQKLGNAKEILEKALKARDLHVESSRKGSSGTITTLRFTDDDGEEEEIEVDEDDMPIASNPSVIPLPSGTVPSPSVSVSPGTSVSPTKKLEINEDVDDDEDDDVRGINTQNNSLTTDFEDKEDKED